MVPREKKDGNSEDFPKKKKKERMLQTRSTTKPQHDKIYHKENTLRYIIFKLPRTKEKRKYIQLKKITFEGMMIKQFEFLSQIKESRRNGIILKC